jgi:hypothetical protein
MAGSQAPIKNIRNVNTAAEGMPQTGEPVPRPFTSFCEYADTKPRKAPTWFTLDDDRPLAVFAGI